MTYTCLVSLDWHLPIYQMMVYFPFNPLNAELNPICHLLALLGPHLIFHVSGLRVKCTLFCCEVGDFTAKKGKAIPLQAWRGPEGSRKFPDYMTTAQDGSKAVSLRYRPSLPHEILLVLISVRGWVDPRAIVRSEGFYVNEKFQWHHLESNQRPSDL